jgi:hypothetical protein
MSIAVLASADPGLVMGQAGDLLAGDPVGPNVVGTKLADAIRYGEPGRYWIKTAGVSSGCRAASGYAAGRGIPRACAAIAGAVDADGVRCRRVRLAGTLRASPRVGQAAQDLFLF